MKLNLYNIEKEYLDLAEQIIENGGEITPELETALAINKESLEIKAVKYGFVKKDLENDIESIDSEIKRLQALKSSRVNTIARLEEAVKTAMKLYGINEIKMQNLKIWFKASEAVKIEDESLIPKRYKITKTETSISKKFLLQELKAGKKVKGASLDKRDNIQFT